MFFLGDPVGGDKFKPQCNEKTLAHKLVATAGDF